MRHALVTAVFASSAPALAQLGDCDFKIYASGGAHGLVGQLSDGQCRIGGGYAPSKFALDQSSGLLTDQNGWGCIITPGDVSQIQCDHSATGR
jgi:hypothetical protein